MQNTKISHFLKLSVAVLIITLTICAISGCTTEQNMASKEEISNSISSVTSFDSGYQYVHLYLRDMGISNYNVSKMLWAETRFQAYYNLEGGLPKTNEHAKLTAEMFISDFYDNIDVTNSDDVTDALLTCYVSVIGDPYSIYRTPVEHTAYDDDMSGEFGGIGVVIEYGHEDETLFVSSVYIDSPAEKAGIQHGDYIIGVDGKSIEEIGYLNAVYYVRGEIGTNVTLTLKRGDSILDITVTRAKVAETTVAYKMLENKIGYVQIVGFKANTDEQFVEAIDYLEDNGVTGIIFDLRGNPGGFVDVVCNMISYLVPNGNAIVSYQYKGGDLIVTDSTDDIHPTKKNPNDATKPLTFDHKISVPTVVICDEYTASAGELFTAALRDYNAAGVLDATIVGHTTFGKGIMQTSWAHLDGSSITMTIAYYNPPSGKNYHHEGITPDKKVDNEIIDNVLVDKQLETAVSELKLLINAK